jgi:hypothetical protein
MCPNDQDISLLWSFQVLRDPGSINIWSERQGKLVVSDWVKVLVD